MVDGVMKVSW